MKKRTLALLLAAALTLSALSGCQSQSAAKDPVGTGNPAATSDPAQAEKATLKVGIFDMYANDSVSARAQKQAEDTIAAAAGMELIRIPMTNYDDESFMTAYESMISRGADAVACMTLSETVLPVLKDLFEEKGVKFFLNNRKVSTPEMENMLFSSPMCLGNDHCDETQNAYEMTKYLHDEYGVKNLAVIGLTKGDTNGDYRDAGIEAACKDLGINLLTETRGIGTTEDVTKAVEGFIASYPEMDGIFIVGGAITSGALAGANQALVNHGLDKKVSMAMIDFSTGMQEYMDEGPLKIAAGGNLICDGIFSLVAIANDLHGTPLNGEDISVINVNMFWITDSASAVNYEKYIEGSVPPFTAEECNAELFKWLNPEVSFDSVQKIASDFSIESVMARHQDLVS